MNGRVAKRLRKEAKYQVGAASSKVAILMDHGESKIVAKSKEFYVYKSLKRQYRTKTAQQKHVETMARLLAELV